MHKIVEWSFCLVLAMSLVLATPDAAYSQEHVVTQAELNQDVAKPTRQRQIDEQRLEQFLSTPVAREAMRRTAVDYTTVEKGIRTLSDAEVARLAARADKAQGDFAAGGVSWAELLLVAIAIIVIVIIVHKI
ncbi:MAG TPA: PA2779 family protein [Candidatus Cybelea sp.]|nr:PA2779 family protein [Candidatus Cybelea sp.]